MRFQNDLGAWDAQTRSENQGLELCNVTLVYLNIVEVQNVSTS